MNIVRQQKLIENFSDQQLQNELMRPSGNVQSFLVLNETERRAKLRKAYANELAKKPETTVVEDAVVNLNQPSAPPSASPSQMMAGLGAGMGQPTPAMPMPRQQPAMPMPQQQPQLMNTGGPVRAQSGAIMRGRPVNYGPQGGIWERLKRIFGSGEPSSVKTKPSLLNRLQEQQQRLAGFQGPNEQVDIGIGTDPISPIYSSPVKTRADLVSGGQSKYTGPKLSLPYLGAKSGQRGRHPLIQQNVNATTPVSAVGATPDQTELDYWSQAGADNLNMVPRDPLLDFQTVAEQVDIGTRGIPDPVVASEGAAKAIEESATQVDELIKADPMEVGNYLTNAVFSSAGGDNAANLKDGLTTFSVDEFTKMRGGDKPLAAPKPKPKTLLEQYKDQLAQYEQANKDKMISKALIDAGAAMMSSKDPRFLGSAGEGLSAASKAMTAEEARAVKEQEAMMNLIAKEADLDISRRKATVQEQLADYKGIEVSQSGDLIESKMDLNAAMIEKYGSDDANEKQKLVLQEARDAVDKAYKEGTVAKKTGTAAYAEWIVDTLRNSSNREDFFDENGRIFPEVLDEVNKVVRAASSRTGDLLKPNQDPTTVEKVRENITRDNRSLISSGGKGGKFYKIKVVDGKAVLDKSTPATKNEALRSADEATRIMTQAEINRLRKKGTTTGPKSNFGRFTDRNPNVDGVWERVNGVPTRVK